MLEAVKGAPKALASAKSARKDGGPVHFSADGRRRRRVSLRAWSVRHSAGLETLYRLFSRALPSVDPVFRLIGYGRSEKPMALVERGVKGFLFDCRMCGTCILSSTGMSCPMNCPKQLRNGPCGGVRANGNCEVVPEMPCVWVKAWEGSRNMSGGDAILDLQPPVDHTLRETSAWLRLMRTSTADREAGA
jgi:hypothetical protein